MSDTVRIHRYPPLALAAGTPFFVWLFGSLTWDEIFLESGELGLAILFGVPFLALAALTLSSWADLLFIRRTGLVLGPAGAEEISAGFVGVHRRAISWEEVGSIDLAGGSVVFAGENRELRVATSDLLESPEWIVERARRMLAPQPLDESLADLDAELAPVSCRSCGAGVEIPPSLLDSVACPSCGTPGPLPQATREALERLRQVARAVPEAHRQVRRDSLLKLLDRGLSLRQGTVVLSWVTAGFLALVAIAGRPESPASWGVPLLLGGSALLFGYGNTWAVKRLAVAWAGSRRALPPPAAGGPARCRLCGGDLPDTGLVRHCPYCDTESLVSGSQLARAEATARRLVAAIGRQLDHGTESAAAVMEGVAGKLQLLALLQLLWLQVPVMAALDGYPGMLRLTAVCAAITLANHAAAILSLRWLRRLESA